MSRQWWHGFRQPKRGRWRIEFPRLDERGFLDLTEIGSMLERIGRTVWHELFARAHFALRTFLFCVPIILGLHLTTSGGPTDPKLILTSLWTRTVSAAAYPGATNEAKITTAIASAAALGFQYVYVPASMLPYNASLITFNANIQMIREGGNPLTYDIQAYGADRTGALPCDAAVQAAINGTFSGGTAPGGIVWVGNGIFKMVTGVTISPTGASSGGISIIGESALTAQFSFAPTINNAACFTFSNGANPIWNCSLQRVQFASPDTTFTKTMVKIVDARHFLANEIVSTSGNWTGGAGTSIGIWTLGREYIDIRRSQIYADRPLVHDINPNSATLSLDMCTIEENQFAVTSGVSQSNIFCVDGTVLTYSTWRNNDCARGTGAFFFNNTLSASPSASNKLINMKSEQSIAGATFSYDIRSSSGQLQNWVLDGCSVDPGLNGIRLRGAFNFSLRNFIIPQVGGTALDVDGTCYALYFHQFLYQTGAALTGLNLVNSYWGTLNTVSGGGLGTWQTGQVSYRGSLFGLVWGASVAWNAQQSDAFTLTATSNIAATIAVPSNPPPANVSQMVTFAIFNNSGGALTTPVAFAAGAGGFLSSGGVSPANGLTIEVTFRFDQARNRWIEIARGVAV